MGGAGSQAFLGQEVGPKGPVRPVVMVFLPDEVVENQELFEQILAETKVAVQIDHPNVISLHGLAKLDEGFARIVEFADAESMRSIFKRLKSQGRKLPPPLATAMMAEACMGVHYAHELGRSLGDMPMIHGGLRPETLLVGFDGHTKVTGFGAGRIAEGLARARGAESSIRDAYTAPEQIFGGRKAATTYTDIYGLGAVLYEALSGKPPFGQDASLAQAITSQQPSPQLLHDVPAPLAAIVLRAMAKEATGRFQSALDMRQALLEQPGVASPEELARFMEWLFPADSPQRQARRELIEQGRSPTHSAALDDAQAQESSGGDLLTENTGLPTPPTSTASPVRLPQTPPIPKANAPHAAPAPLPAATLRPQAAAQTPVQAAAAPALATPQTPPPIASPAPLAPQVVSATLSPQQPAPVIINEPQVVYRTPPIVYAGLGLLIGGAVVLAAVVLLRPASPAVTTTAQPLAAPAQTPVAATQATPDAALAAPVVAAGPRSATNTNSPAPSKANTKPRPRTRKTRRVRPKTKIAPATQTAATGVLIIEAPTGSAVLVDGKSRGTAPIQPLELRAGRHKVIVKQQGTGVQYRRTVTVKADLDLTMTVQFYNN